MSRIDPHPAFIVHGGDSYPHFPNESEPVAQAVYNSSHLLRKYFPNTPIIYTLGNHDLFPAHHVLPNSTWLQTITDQISDFLNEEQQFTFSQGGYYSAHVNGLKLIVVNTNYYFILNKYTWFKRKDIGNQWQWMKKELDLAKKFNQKVLIVGHIPPGFSERFYMSEFKSAYENDHYLETLEGYGDMIIGHLYGHQHSDAYRLSKDNGVMFITPSLQCERHHPAMARRFFFDDTNFSLLSYEQYYSQLEKDNAEKKITWELEYATNQQPYNLPDLSLKSFTELTTRLKSDKDLF